MQNIVAVITFDANNNAIIEVGPEKFRFSCKQCASLCCKLGGPVISKGEIEDIEAVGFYDTDFFEPVARTSDCSLLVCGQLKSRDDGSCVFLSFDEKKQCSVCDVYDCRPSFCRLYPFSFERLDSKRVALKIIPCCQGLNNPDGELIDEKYISGHILEPLLEAMKLKI